MNNITIDKCSKMGLLFKVYFKKSKASLMHIDFFTNSLHIIQGVVAACEIVNCNSIEVQCEVDEICFLDIQYFVEWSSLDLVSSMKIASYVIYLIMQGSVPTISIDNTSGCQLYLSKESLETSITTAKSSEINALVPDANSDGDWVSTSLNSFHSPFDSLLFKFGL